ncbi:MAG: BLUF domain-containing protein [Gammaproteobacteria bacterium]
MALFQLVYVSTARADLGAADLEDILAAANQHNALRDVTGMLMYADGQFMQLLEGEEAAVEAIFARIQTDTRHHDVTVLERGPITRRDFADWHMGYKHVGDGALQYRAPASPGGAPNLAGAVQSSRADDAPEPGTDPIRGT